MREGGGPKEGECTKEGEGFEGRELELPSLVHQIHST